MSRKPVIAAQLYTLRDFLKTPADVETTMNRVRKIGYDAAQISGVGPIEPAELRRIMTDAGVEPIGAHVGLAEFRDDLGGVIEKCHAWGVDYVAIPWLPRKEFTTRQDWMKLFREMDGYARKLKKDGLTVQYHNHCFEFEKFGVRNGRGGETLLGMLFRNTTVLQSELDIGWVVRGGHNPLTWIHALKGRLDQVHLKDWGILDDQPVWRAIGEGGIEWAAVLKACCAAGTVHFIVEQDSCPLTNDPFLSLAVSRKNLADLRLG